MLHLNTAVVSPQTDEGPTVKIPLNVATLGTRVVPTKIPRPSLTYRDGMWVPVGESEMCGEFEARPRCISFVPSGSRLAVK